MRKRIKEDKRNEEEKQERRKRMKVKERKALKYLMKDKRKDRANRQAGEHR